MGTAIQVVVDEPDAGNGAPDFRRLLRYAGGGVTERNRATKADQRPNRPGSTSPIAGVMRSGQEPKNGETLAGGLPTVDSAVSDRGLEHFLRSGSEFAAALGTGFRTVLARTILPGDDRAAIEALENFFLCAFGIVV